MWLVGFRIIEREGYSVSAGGGVIFVGLDSASLERVARDIYRVRYSRFVSGRRRVVCENKGGVVG